jgi:hypothetical protein
MAAFSVWKIALSREITVAEQDDDLLPDDPDESHYTPVSHIKVSASDETLDFTLSLRTTDGGIFRFSLDPKQACEIMAWFPFVACEQAKRVNLNEANAVRNFVPVPITQISGEAGRSPGEALLVADAGQLTLAMAVDLDSLRGLQKWIDQMLRFVPPSEGGGMH